MNKSNPYKNFNTKKDYTKWSNFLEQVDSIENLSDADRVRARKAFGFLETVLGKHFLAEIIRHGHPLLNQYFKNTAAVARIEIINFAESLESLENSPNFNTLIDKIKKATSFSEGSTILEDAHKFHRAGFSVGFDIKATFTENERLRTTKPDIKLTNSETGEDLYIEVSEIRESDMSVDNGRTHHTFFDFIHNAVRLDPEMTDFAHPKHILPYVLIHRIFTETELINTITEIQRLIDKVRKDGEFQELIIENIIEVGVSPFHDHSKAREWAARRDLSDFVEMTPFNPNELKRVINSLIRELDQLPLDTPGIVSLWNNHNLLFFLHDIPTIINTVANKIAGHSNLFGVALNYNYGSSNEATTVVEIDEHLFTNNVGRDSIARTTLFVKNKFFNLPITDSTKTKIQNSFINSLVEDC